MDIKTIFQILTVAFFSHSFLVSELFAQPTAGRCENDSMRAKLEHFVTAADVVRQRASAYRMSHLSGSSIGIDLNCDYQFEESIYRATFEGTSDSNCELRNAKSIVVKENGYYHPRLLAKKDCTLTAEGERRCKVSFDTYKRTEDGIEFAFLVSASIYIEYEGSSELVLIHRVDFLNFISIDSCDYEDSSYGGGGGPL